MKKYLEPSIQVMNIQKEDILTVSTGLQVVDYNESNLDVLGW